jgi:hypothetical protein
MMNEEATTRRNGIRRINESSIGGEPTDPSLLKHFCL